MKEFECVKCSKRFTSEGSLEQHNHSKHGQEHRKKEFDLNSCVKYSLILIIVILSVFTVYSYSQKPGKYDDFAKCLTEQGAVVYGNDYCSYTMDELGFFRKSKEHLNYVKCIDNQELCDGKGVSITPTWEIEGKMYEGVQGLNKLAEVTGC